MPITELLERNAREFPKDIASGKKKGNMARL